MKCSIRQIQGYKWCVILLQVSLLRGEICCLKAKQWSVSSFGPQRPGIASLGDEDVFHLTFLPTLTPSIRLVSPRSATLMKFFWMMTKKSSYDVIHPELTAVATEKQYLCDALERCEAENSSERNLSSIHFE